MLILYRHHTWHLEMEVSSWKINYKLEMFRCHVWFAGNKIMGKSIETSNFQLGSVSRTKPKKAQDMCGWLKPVNAQKICLVLYPKTCFNQFHHFTNWMGQSLRPFRPCHPGFLMAERCGLTIPKSKGLKLLKLSLPWSLTLYRCKLRVCHWKWPICKNLIFYLWKVVIFQ